MPASAGSSRGAVVLPITVPQHATPLPTASPHWPWKPVGTSADHAAPPGPDTVRRNGPAIAVPSWRAVFEPQHVTTPLASAHVCARPAATLDASGTKPISFGVPTSQSTPTAHGTRGFVVP